MKYSITVKFIAVFLAALLLVAAAASAFGVAILVSLNQYSISFETWYEQTCEARANTIADWVCQRYGLEYLSGLSPSHWDYTWLYSDSDGEISDTLGLKEDGWTYRICDEEGEVLQTGNPVEAADASYKLNVSFTFPIPVENTTGEILFYDEYDKPVYVTYADSPAYTVTVDMCADVLQVYNGLSIGFLELFFGMRYGFVAALVISLVLFAVCAVYLCCAAGKSHAHADPMPGGLNRLPLDAYLAAAGAACVLLAMLAFGILDNWFYDNGAYNLGAVALAAVVLMLAAVIAIGFFVAVAAQFKMRNFYWWHHSIIGWCGDKLWKGIRFMFRMLARLIRMMPVLWRWLLVAAGMALAVLISMLIVAVEDSGVWFLILVLLGCGAVICYGAYAYGMLLTGVKRMAEGTLNTKVSTKYLVGSYKECAQALNALADVAMVAAQKQMQSERMKTELITNVSHDIKTPLTSIINYVDLLEKPHTEQEQEQYLEVLGRQSQRLKKLIEDLMEMSKATTGNMAVEITQVDGGEAVNQALGEFADKLEQAQLLPVFRQPEQPVILRADGRLTWRVLSNLLSNIVKYALPGTRVYIDMTETADCVLISLKNISREELNISAQELTERFVRGDASRNTEGSGLGLNIAKSLMELQKGQLQLLVDGDLFKVTLIFPKA